MTDFFPGFEPRRITTSGAEINLVTGGSGPPLLLLHGYPQTHLMWRKLAPRLAAEFTVVVPDLRGYGDSTKPPAGPDNAGYSKRALALDQVETMRTLGFDRFAVAGHDRGAHRLARDHLERVERLALLDIVPTLYRFETIDQKAATSRLALVLSDSTHAGQRRAGYTPNDAGPILLFRPRANSLLFGCFRDSNSLIRQKFSLIWGVANLRSKFLKYGLFWSAVRAIPWRKTRFPLYLGVGTPCVRRHRAFLGDPTTGAYNSRARCPGVLTG